MFNCLAVDIGAGSGRVLRGTFEDDKMSLEEVHRFENEIEIIDGHHRWDVDKLFTSVCEGLKKASTQSTSSIGVDTWGVDYVLLDENGEKLELPVAYRDDRTKGMMERFYDLMPKSELYAKTGIQFMEFNTVFQFMAMIEEESPLLAKAKSFLMIPDFLTYRLTGEEVNEFSNVSTTQMMNADNRTWDSDIIKALGLNENLFKKPVMPGDKIGELTTEMSAETGLSKTPVYAVASHDTGSAVAASPAYGKDWAYISSGTWCLMGVESDTPVTDEKAFEYNLTNEGGVNGTSRILKNIMGLWLIRGIQSSLDTEYSFPELLGMAAECEPFKHIIYANDQSFTNPDSMCDTIDQFCIKTGQGTPQTPGEYIRCAEEGLAFLYRQVLGELRDVYEHPINRLHILGGGVQDKMMCQFAADATGLTVHAGPIEATAIGNLIVQAMALGVYESLEDARKVVFNSFEIETYQPVDTAGWDENYNKFLNIKEQVTAL